GAHKVLQPGQRVLVGGQQPSEPPDLVGASLSLATLALTSWQGRMASATRLTTVPATPTTVCRAWPSGCRVLSGRAESERERYMTRAPPANDTRTRGHPSVALRLLLCLLCLLRLLACTCSVIFSARPPHEIRRGPAQPSNRGCLGPAPSFSQQHCCCCCCC